MLQLYMVHFIFYDIKILNNNLNTTFVIYQCNDYIQCKYNINTIQYNKHSL